MKLSDLHPRTDTVLITGIITSLRTQMTERGKRMFITLDDIEALCDKHYGEGVWDEYSLYLDDRLPKPLEIDF